MCPFSRYECVPAPVSTTVAPPTPLTKKLNCRVEGKTIVTFDNATLVNDFCYNTILESREENISIKCKYELFL